MNKIYIIDAVNYLFRSYYAIGPMTNEKGESTSALYGFIRSVQKLIKIANPSHIVCVFDGPDNKRKRQDLYTEYKSHRKEAPQDLFPQFEWAKEYCEYAGIPILCIEGVEADDVMATVALWAEKEKSEAYLCTSDKDLTQLVNTSIFVLHPHKEYQLVNEQKVEEIYGVKPSQVRDFLAITGDASDNIPGIKGFGPKTAADLLQKFGTLQKILDHPEQVEGEKKQKTLIENKEIALLSQKLATLHTDIEIPIETSFYSLKPSQKEKLHAFYQRMKFLSLLKEIIPSEEKTSSIAPIKKEYHLIQTKEELETLLQSLKNEKEIGIDTETTSVQPLLASLVGISFSVQPGEAWYIPCNGSLEKEFVLERLSHFFSAIQGTLFGHNIKYDLHVLKNHGIELRKIGFDTMLASYLLNPQDRRHNLDELSLEYFQHVKIPIERLIGKGKEEISMEIVPLDQITEYSCEDIDYTTRLKNLFSKEIKKQNLQFIFEKIEIPLIPILADMEREGIYLNLEKLKTIEKPILLEIERLKKEIFQEAKEEFNLNSPKQLSHILFEKLNIKKPAKARTSFGTGADVLEEIVSEHPIIPHILHFRTLEKLRATYIEALPLSVNPKTQRIHPSFNQSVTATGRLSCNNPNLQNIPVRTKEGLAIRSCFTPQQPGWSFLSADYSQIELRLLAHFSEDPDLMSAFEENQDIHAHTASLIFNLPITMITPDMRTAAKTVNFGILYGQTPFGLASQLHISLQEASHFIKKYFERFPSILQYLDSCKESARKTGKATTLMGRQRPIPEIDNKNPMIRAGAERLAINTPLQGTAADLIKKAMILIQEEIQKKGCQGRMILQIHDELIFEVPDLEIPLFKTFVRHHMEKAIKLKVPIVVDMAVGKNWAEC
jgi:DNA polymerase-1